MAVQLTVVVPIGKVLPDAGVQTTVGLGSVVSVAVTVNVTTAPAGTRQLELQCLLASSGQVLLYPVLLL